jgi:excinuclease ABC subunit B
MQYERNDMDFHRGTFRVRGDIIDIFPAEHAEHAIRVSLVRRRDRRPAVLRPADRPSAAQGAALYTVFPASHYVTPRATVVRAIEAIKDELRDRIEFFTPQQAGRGAAHRATHPFRPRVARPDRFLQGHRELLPPFFRAQAGEPPPTLIDYLPPMR